MKQNNVLNDPAFLSSKLFPPTVKPSSKHDIHIDDSLTSQLSIEKFQFKAQLTSIYMVSPKYKFQMNPNRNNDHYVYYACKQLHQFGYLTQNNKKKRKNTDDSNPNLQFVIEKRVHHETYKRFFGKSSSQLHNKIPISI